MASDRSSLQALKNLIAEADLILETTPALPENRTNAAAILGHKGGSTTARKLGADHYRRMAQARKTHGGERPRKQSE